MVTVWINGTFVSADHASLPLNDSGILNGIGVFDTMLAIDGTPQHGEEHFARLRRHAHTVMGLTTDDDFMDIAITLLQRAGLTQGRARVRTCITGGVIPSPLSPATNPSRFMQVSAAPENTIPVHAWIIPDFPRVAGCALETCKRLDYTRAYAARRAAEALGGNDAIMTNTNGMVACAATSNIFIVEDGQWFTPPLEDGVLDGITRRHVLLEKDAVEESMLPERVEKADAVYICNSMTGLRPLSSLNGKDY